MTLPPLNTPIQHTGGATCPVHPQTMIVIDPGETPFMAGAVIFWYRVTTYIIIARAPADRIKELEAALRRWMHTGCPAMTRPLGHSAFERTPPMTTNPQLAYAIVGKDGRIVPGHCYGSKASADRMAEAGASITPVLLIPRDEAVRWACQTLGLTWRKTIDGLPKKPGVKNYEYVECLILKKDGDIEIGMWNCEHEVWDDDQCDDFRYDPTEPVAWMPIAALRALAGQEGGA